MLGQLCVIGTLPNATRVFYYSIVQGLHIELIDRRNRDLKHVVRLVAEDGTLIPIPKGARFEHVRSEECMNLLDHHLKSEEQKSRLPA